MNLYELDRLIESCREHGDLGLVEFYNKKRVQLLAMISDKINQGMKQL